MFSIRGSLILNGVQSSGMGLQEDSVVVSLLGLSNVMILPCFELLEFRQWALV